jgi:hypothetical protein
MATDKSIKYTATVDDNPFAAATRRMAENLSAMQQRWLGVGSSWGTTSSAMGAQIGQLTQSVAGGVTSMGGHFSGLLEGITRTSGGMMAMVGVAGALAATKAVKATAEMTEGAMDLGRVLGSSTNEAQQWRLALEDVGASQGDLEGAAKGMARQLKENEASMQAMGLSTRDASGNLRPMTDLLQDGLDILNQHKEGADRALASQQLFGRGVDASSKLLLVNKDTLAEAKATMQELGLEVGGNAVQAWKNWDSATDRAGFSVKGLGNTVGTILMPVMTDLVKLFNLAMPYAIVIARGAIGGLVSAFYFLQTGVRTTWEVINAMVVSIAEPIRAVVEAVGRAMVGDFTGAATVMKSVPGTIQTAWSTAFDNIAESAADTRARVAAIFTPDTTPGAPEGQRGTKGYKPPPDKGGKPAAEASDMPYFQNALEQVKLYYAQTDTLREFSKQQELDFWNTILQNTNLATKDRLAIQKKATELEVQVLREKAKEAQQIDAIGLKSWEDRELARVAMSEQAAREALALGRITQGQLLQQEEQFEQSRQAIKLGALTAKLATLDPDRDPVKYAEVNAQIEALELAHQQRLAGIRGQVAVESAAELNAIWSDLGSRMSGLWDSGVQAMMNGTLTWRNAMRATGTELVGWFAGIVKRKVVTWVTGEEALTAATAAGTMQRWAMESWAAAKSVALWAATAVKNIMVSAWEAMAAAWKAIVGIPYVGPYLAPIAAAAAFAGVANLAGNIASAEGGFDIPRGVNPMVQLHEQEMVLPRAQADVIRNMAADGGAPAARGGDLHLHLRGASVGDFFLVHRADLVKAMKQAHRDGHITGIKA